MKLESLEELLIHELQDLYSAETMLIKALPKMAQKASSPQLKTAFETHLQQTEGHKRRLDQIFDELRDIDREDKKGRGLEGIIKEGGEVIKADAEPEVRDAALMSAAQRVEHYEIAAYGTVRTYAQLLGRTTNNVAEWTALLEGLKAALARGVDEIDIRLDSELVVRQLDGAYRVKHAGLIPLHAEAKALLRKFAHHDVRHVRRHENKAADALVNQVLDAHR